MNDFWTACVRKVSTNHTGWQSRTGDQHGYAGADSQVDNFLVVGGSIDAVKTVLIEVDFHWAEGRHRTRRRSTQLNPRCKNTPAGCQHNRHARAGPNANHHFVQTIVVASIVAKVAVTHGHRCRAPSFAPVAGPKLAKRTVAKGVEAARGGDQRNVGGRGAEVNHRVRQETRDALGHQTPLLVPPEAQLPVWTATPNVDVAEVGQGWIFDRRVRRRVTDGLRWSGANGPQFHTKRKPCQVSLAVSQKGPLPRQGSNAFVPREKESPAATWTNTLPATAVISVGVAIASTADPWPSCPMSPLPQLYSRPSAEIARVGFQRRGGGLSRSTTPR